MIKLSELLFYEFFSSTSTKKNFNEKNSWTCGFRPAPAPAPKSQKNKNPLLVV